MADVMYPIKAPRKPVQRVSTGVLPTPRESLEGPVAPLQGAGNTYVKEDSPSFSQLKEDLEWADYYMDGSYDPRCI